jgi:hypothetical protein
MKLAEPRFGFGMHQMHVESHSIFGKKNVIPNKNNTSA